VTDVGGRVVAPGGDTVIRTGGEPVPSDVLVNVDGITIKGDGSLEHPLTAPGSGGLLPIVHGPKPIASGVVVPVAGKLNVFDLSNGGTFSVDFPPASSVPNGTSFCVLFVGVPGGVHLTWVPSGADTLDGGDSGFAAVLASLSAGIASGANFSWYSDGVSSWWLVF
jgi:hypothetical protein